MTSQTPIHWRTIATPIGPLTFAWNAQGLLVADFSDKTDDAEEYISRKGLGTLRPSQTKSSSYETALEKYFSGDLRALGAVKVAPVGTDFSLQVWQELCRIPPGSTKTYGEVAARLDRPKASRAVGMACNRNPIAVVVPCHRVVGQSGSLTGYAGGLHLKEWLLTHEGIETKPNQYRLL
jgi:methylated-DNA-[protein]-cysteine S-methyltransferase